ncbi:MAG: UDP-glucose--hexose-1-phosphate uridylyltransferase [Chitinivibrionales bacterium]|nr:UDP-glucose--hexose-1-phosphate uridylyltransferase [Chitinivibrionales bacterium]
MKFFENPHRRLNPLTGEWILVSPHRTKRPWQGKVEEAQRIKQPQYDPGCYLCPGNTRAGGAVNPGYKTTFVFENDFAALLPEAPQGVFEEHDILRAHTERGICRVICFSPRHDLTLAIMEVADIDRIVCIWQEQYRDLGAVEFINYVQIFENRGAVMGCSNPHPHGQIWSNETIPQLPALEHDRQNDYLRRHNSCLLCDYLNVEQQKRDRIVYENDSFVALVPFWAVWPYETILLPRAHHGDIAGLSATGRRDLADALKIVCVKYDNLFLTSFPYSMGIHQQPTDKISHEAWHFHFHFYPPLLRSAMVRKFMVGYEMLGQPQRDITAEQAAKKLAECSSEHYTST